ncbi:uncharacterized protein LOC123723303 [Papilio machaon]|uniref:uncharacterized protein LOC123723303 n=1 Tax=Papilio machaon TaxID=76193 RepID=UPI001E66605A|nr:uncharacterized protein LOC123723303 [Papilio machaon]
MDIQTLKKSRASFKSKLTVFKKFLDTLLPSKTINSVQELSKPVTLSSIHNILLSTAQGFIINSNDHHRRSCWAITQMKAIHLELVTDLTSQGFIDALNRFIARRDLIPLTPAHFLIGRTITMSPAPQVENHQLSTLSKFKRIQQLKSHFWTRYYKEYLSELQSRSKWRTRGTQPQSEEMVVVKDDRLPPNRWLIGRITGVHPGSDGVNRVADVLTTTGTLRRAYNRLCPLPAALDQDAPDPRGAACLRHI